MRATLSVKRFFGLPIVRFAIVGGFNTALTYGIYLFFYLYVGLFYQLALLFEYSIGIVVGYLLNRYWTFVVDHSMPQSKSTQSFMRYAATYAGVYLGNVVLLSTIVETGWLSPVFGQIVSLAIISLLSFVMQKYWVFARQGGDSDL